MLGRLLQTITSWALARNDSGFKGQDEKRWAYTIGTSGSPYLTRVMVPWRLFGIRPFLHHMHREDLDRDLHNHPWAWAISIVLSGSYDEVRLTPDAEDLALLAAYVPRSILTLSDFVITRRVRRINVLTSRDYHRITQLHGDVWTLFITGPRVQEWGFLVEGKHVPERDYLTRTGRPTP